MNQIKFTKKELFIMMRSMLSVDNDHINSVRGLDPVQSAATLSGALDKIFQILKGDSVRVGDLKLYVQAENKKAFQVHKVAIEQAIKHYEQERYLRHQPDLYNLLNILGMLMGMDLFRSGPDL